MSFKFVWLVLAGDREKERGKLQGETIDTLNLETPSTPNSYPVCLKMIEVL